VMAMFGSEREQTGYSHEPVGIIMDVSAFEAINQINQAFELFAQGRGILTETTVENFLVSLQALVGATFSYDEMNQMGGRALRTPHGHVKYVQRLSNINSFLADVKPQSPLFALEVETQFEDIFIANEVIAQEKRASITFNRVALSFLNQPEPMTLADYYKRVGLHFAEIVSDDRSKRQCEQYMHYRLPLLWAMKYQRALVVNYLSFNKEDFFDEIRLGVADDLQRVPPRRELVTPLCNLRPILPMRPIEASPIDAKPTSAFTTKAMFVGIFALAGISYLGSSALANSLTANAHDLIGGMSASLFVTVCTIGVPVVALLLYGLYLLCNNYREANNPMMSASNRLASV
jgi:hypothetical protein